MVLVDVIVVLTLQKRLQFRWKRNASEFSGVPFGIALGNGSLSSDVRIFCIALVMHHCLKSIHGAFLRVFAAHLSI